MMKKRWIVITSAGLIGLAIFILYPRPDTIDPESTCAPETALASERPLIAGVFIRRLRSGMRLQTDPTVIYGLGSRFDGNLTRRHLETDSPWNTYTRADAARHSRVRNDRRTQRRGHRCRRSARGRHRALFRCYRSRRRQPPL